MFGALATTYLFLAIQYFMYESVTNSMMHKLNRISERKIFLCAVNLVIMFVINSSTDRSMQPPLPNNPKEELREHNFLELSWKTFE